MGGLKRGDRGWQYIVVGPCINGFPWGDMDMCGAQAVKLTLTLPSVNCRPDILDLVNDAELWQGLKFLQPLLVAFCKVLAAVQNAGRRALLADMTRYFLFVARQTENFAGFVPSGLSYKHLGILLHMLNICNAILFRVLCPTAVVLLAVLLVWLKVWPRDSCTPFGCEACPSTGALLWVALQLGQAGSKRCSKLLTSTELNKH